MKARNLLMSLALSAFATQFIYSQGRMKPQDWVGDYVEKLSVFSDEFNIDLVHGKSYHELGNNVVRNSTLVSTEPVNITQYAYFLMHYLKENSGSDIPESWIPASIAITRNRKVTYVKEDASLPATIENLDGARAFCVWLTSWANKGREGERLPHLPFFRVTSLGETIMASTDSLASYFFINKEEYSKPFKELEAGIVRQNRKVRFDGTPAGFYVGISVKGEVAESN